MESPIVVELQSSQKEKKERYVNRQGSTERRAPKSGPVIEWWGFK